MTSDFASYLAATAKNNFWGAVGGDWALGYISTQV